MSGFCHYLIIIQFFFNVEQFQHFSLKSKLLEKYFFIPKLG
jgi:hypothetical protein